MRSYAPYIPKTPGELWDLLGSMVLGAPRFIDTGGDFPGMNIDTEFHALTEGFRVIREKLGEDRYVKLMTLAEKAKALFVETSEDELDKIRAGCALLFEMEEIINELRRRRPPTSLASS